MFESVGGFGGGSGGGGGTVTAANNGVSLDGTTVVLGNDVGDNSAVFLSNREIPMGGFYSKWSNGTMWFDGTTGATPTSGAGTRLMWIPEKAAFRAGINFGTENDDANIGLYSTAFGYGASAPGGAAFATGWSLASGAGSFASGTFQSGGTGAGKITASGENAFNHSFMEADIFAAGARGAYSVILGGKNNEVNANNTGVVLLGGNTMTTVPSGVTYTTFTPALRVYDSAASSTMVVGSTTFTGTEKIRFTGGAFLYDGETGDTPVSGSGTRMMWIPAKSSFRAGRLSGSEATYWNDVNIGDYSVAMGGFVKAAGAGSVSLGYNNRIDAGGACFAAGGDNVINNVFTGGAIAVGTSCSVSTSHGGSALCHYANVTGRGAVAIGLGVGDGNDVGLTEALGGNNLAIGKEVIANGTNGCFIIGMKGLAASAPTNTTGMSLWVGFNKTTPDLFIKDGAIGVGNVTSPTARLHLQAGTATANTAPLKFTSGTNLTAPEAGVAEYDGTNLYFTPASTRETIAFLSGSGASTQGNIITANKAPKILFADAVLASHTGSTTLTTLKTITIPANTLRANSILRVTLYTSCTNNANSKTFRVTVGGVDYSIYVVTTDSSDIKIMHIACRNAANSQVYTPASAIAGVGSLFQAVPTATIDFTALQTMNFTVQLGNAADTARIEMIMVEVIN